MQSRSPLVITLAILLTAALGYVDYRLGYEISFAFFYVIPVSITAWLVGMRAALSISIISAAAWQFSNQLAGETFSSEWIAYWNAVTRLGFFFVVSFLLATVKQDLEIQRTLARTDPLTGALNGRIFMELVSYELTRSQRQEKSFSIAYFDLDHFKKVNDTRGHSEGDELLRTVVGTVRGALRTNDVSGRLGGDEFAILLPDTDGDQVITLVTRLRQQLLDAMRQKSWPVTFSIGVVTFRTPPANADEALRLADQQMYSIKRAGRNGVQYLVHGA